MGSNPAPAIRRRYGEKDAQADVIEQIYDDLYFTRGLGESGVKVQRVDLSSAEEGLDGCPQCGADEMFRSIDVHAEGDDYVVYYCTRMVCPHFVEGALKNDTSGLIRASKPRIWTNSAECPSCESRHRVEIERDSPLHGEAESGNSCIVNVKCDDCRGGRA